MSFEFFFETLNARSMASILSSCTSFCRNFGIQGIMQSKILYDATC